MLDDVASAVAVVVAVLVFILFISICPTLNTAPQWAPSAPQELNLKIKN